MLRSSQLKVWKKSLFILSNQSTWMKKSPTTTSSLLKTRKSHVYVVRLHVVERSTKARCTQTKAMCLHVISSQTFNIYFIESPTEMYIRNSCFIHKFMSYFWKCTENDFICITLFIVVNKNLGIIIKMWTSLIVLK